MTQERFDYVIVGAGIGGLFSAALLARSGFRVCLLERHYAPGGYGHSFVKAGYTFCAQLHYLWNCGPADEFGNFLRRLGLEDRVRFNRLNPDGFDRLFFPSFRYDIVNGFPRNLERLAARFPDQRPGLARYFEIITRINAEVLQAPLGSSPWPLLQRPWKFPYLIRYRNWTTEKLFDKLGLALELRSILAGQSGDLLLPPSQASLLVHAALVCGYDGGAWVPEQSYAELFATLVDFINGQPGCRVILKSWVAAFEEHDGRITAARTKKGIVYPAERFLFNGDPQLLPQLLAKPPARWFRRRLDYEYSTSCFTLYLGVRGLNLEQFGFGNWNVWHYAHDDVEECYRQQVDRRQMDNPSLFISTPTLHPKTAHIVPDGCHQLVVCTPCAYDHFKSLQSDRAAYLKEKERVAQRIVDQLERHYLPNLRQHLNLVVPGTPTTNERFVLAPQGNAYGANLTPGQFNVGKVDYRTPYPNLWLVGATAGAPSFAAGVHFALLLFEKLIGEKPLAGSRTSEASDYEAPGG
jgi:phytoene dehydrogenase-like protein